MWGSTVNDSNESDDLFKESAALSLEVNQADLDCDPRLYLGGRSKRASSNIFGKRRGGNAVTPTGKARKTSFEWLQSFKGQDHGGRRFGGAPPQVAQYLALTDLEYHADTKAPIFACFLGSRAMQTTFAKREMALVGSIVSMVLFYLGLRSLLMQLRIISSDDLGCPEPINVLHNYFFWLHLRTVVGTSGVVFGFVYWHLVRRQPGCTYRRWLVGHMSFVGLLTFSVAVYGAVLVSIEAEEGRLDPKFCLDMDDDNFNEKIPDLAADITSGLGWLYVFFWQGAVARNEPRAFLAFMCTMVLLLLLYGFSNLEEGNPITGSLQALCGFLIFAFTTSLPIRHRRMQRRLADLIGRDREAFIAAWSEHADDVERIESLVALCADLPKTKPRQTSNDLLVQQDAESAKVDTESAKGRRVGQGDAESGTTENHDQPTTGKRGSRGSLGLMRKFSFPGTEVLSIRKLSFRRRSLGSSGLIVDRFELFRRAYVFHRPYEICLQRALVPDDTGTAEFKMAPVKAPERVYLKLIRSYNGDWSQVCDMIRCSAIYETLAELRDGLQRLKNDPAVEILQVKNRFDPSFDVNVLGYRDLKMLVTLPGVTRGYLAEVQLHLKSIILVQTGEGHQAYVHARNALGG